MVRYTALFALLLSAPAMADDGLAYRVASPHGTSARAEATVTIVRGEAIAAIPQRRKGQANASSTPPTDRQHRAMPDHQIRIDFF